MTAVWITRRHDLLRLDPDGTAAATALAMAAESGCGGGWHLHALPAGPPTARWEPSARTVQRELAEKGDAALGGASLLIETGTVTVEAGLDATLLERRRRPYYLVRDGDHVLHLRDGSRPPAALPWSWAAPVDAVRPEDPVVLGPTALLALVAARQEADPTERGDTEPAAAPSPYPPHDAALPPLPGHLAAALAGTDLAGVAELLADPALWHVPQATFTTALRPRPRTGRLRRGPAPRRALVLDSLVRRGRHADGRLEWSGGFSLRDGSGGTGRGTVPLLVRGDPAELLRRTVHACGAERPALARDPIGRATYTLAPPVTTSLRADEVIVRADRPDPHGEG